MPFAKGQSGNPNGRPKGSKNHWSLLTDELRKALEKTVTVKGKNVTALEGIIQAMIQKAQAGDVQAAMFIADRVQGKPHQAIEVSTTTPAKLEVILTNGKPKGEGDGEGGGDSVAGD